MGLLDLQGTRVLVEMLQAGQLMQNAYDYHNAVEGDFQHPLDIGNQWLTSYKDALLGCLGEDVLLSSVTVTTTINGGAYPAYPPAYFGVNEFGSVADQALPPFVSARLIKVPDNATIDPPTGFSAFRNGMLRISGIPESFQNNGFLNVTGTTAYGILAADLHQMTVGGDVYDMHMTRIIPHEAAPTDYVMVTVIGVAPSSSLGTQNTRKR